MLRNVYFTLGGIGLFVAGVVSGPHIMPLFTTEQASTVTQTKESSSPLAEKISPNTLVVSEKKDTVPSKEEKQSSLPSEEKSDAAINQEKATEEKVVAAQEDTQPVKDGEISPTIAPDPDDATFPDEGLQAEDGTENLDTHTPSSEEDAAAPEVKEQIIEAKIETGDSLLVIFEDYTDRNSAYKLVDVIDDEISVKKFRVGQPYLIEYDAEKDKIIRFEYEINSKEKLFVAAEGDTHKAKIEKIFYDRKLVFVEGEIKDSLFLTVTELNESPQLAMQVANMFQWDINFIRDVQAGDSFSILVEKLYRDGEFKGYGRAIGATFTNGDKKYESFLYYDANKKEMHYNAKGENKRKVLLQSPLSFTRVTSGYTHSRKHPVYGNYRPHLGIDYGAPMGTPIMAVGDGTITYFGWRGGYGKHITVRHASGLESMYSHMSRYGRGLKKGSKVRQGQVIGYVGSTGVSTGPHLDFRLKQNGKFINPGKAINPRAAAIGKVHKQGYDARKKMVREYMDGTRALSSYDPASIDVPK